MRDKFLYWFVSKVLKIPQGCMLPVWVVWLRYLLRPRLFIACYCHYMKYNPQNDCYIYRDVKLSRRFLDLLAEMKAGQRIIVEMAKDKSGIIVRIVDNIYDS